MVDLILKSDLKLKSEFDIKEDEYMGPGAAAMVKGNLLGMNQWDTRFFMDLSTWHCQCAVHGLDSLAKDGRIHRLFVTS